MGERWDDTEVENLRRAHEHAVHERARAARDRILARPDTDPEQNDPTRHDPEDHR